MNLVKKSYHHWIYKLWLKIIAEFKKEYDYKKYIIEKNLVLENGNCFLYNKKRMWNCKKIIWFQKTAYNFCS